MMSRHSLSRAVFACLAGVLGVLSSATGLAETLSVAPLGADPWFTGPESAVNSAYTLAHPAGASCGKRVPLWVMDVGTAIPDNDGHLQYIVGGDTFYLPEGSSEACRLSAGNRLYLCTRVEPPWPFEGVFDSECQVDADCAATPHLPLDPVGYICDPTFKVCVQPDLHLFCNRTYDRTLLPEVVKFCYRHRGTPAIPAEHPGTYGEHFCEWMAGDHHCQTQLYDTTCEESCMASPRVAECKDDRCDIRCTRTCNEAGHCRHRNQTFHEARIEPDGKGGKQVRLRVDRPELFIPRTPEEWEDVELFGVYPGDYFRDLNGALYLLTDTRTWLATSLANEHKRAGLGLYSLTENARLRFPGVVSARAPLTLWKEKDGAAVETATFLNPNDSVLFPRGGPFSEAMVVHGLARDAYRPPSDTQTYVHLMGSGPPCPQGVDCTRAFTSNQAFLARAPLADQGFRDHAKWEVFAGLVDGRSVWMRINEAVQAAKPIIAYSGFRPSTVLSVRGEYFHLDSLPDPESGEYEILQLLRSPDGLTWFDGGTFPVLTLETPRRTRFVYAAKWLPPADTAPDLGFILSHWLSYDGYFLAASPAERFRDYNMKTYNMRMPKPRAYLVHSPFYTPKAKGPLAMPISLYVPPDSRDLRLAMQVCECPRGLACESACPAWAAFEESAGPWRFAAALTLNGVALKRDERTSFPGFVVPQGRTNGRELMRSDLSIAWDYPRDGAGGRRVVLRFGLYAARDVAPLKSLHESGRLLPELYAGNPRYAHEPQGWHRTEPITLP